MIFLNIVCHRLYNQVAAVMHNSYRNFPDIPSAIIKCSKTCETSFKLSRACVEVNNGKGNETERRYQQKNVVKDKRNT